MLPQFRPLFPEMFTLYIEPFLGGGAVFFDLQPLEKSVLIDSNFELMNFYQVVKTKLDALLADLERHENTEDYYYHIRSINPDHLTGVGRASRFLYMNKTGFNGLWRVNRQGRHNVPYGRYKSPQFRDEANLRKISLALQNSELVCGDFSQALAYATPGAFVYLDPPYHPLTKTARFTSYTRDSFNDEDQIRLSRVFRELHSRGCYVMLSNSDTDFIRDLYEGFEITTVYARRAINCRGDRRGPIPELVIRNYR